MFVELRKVSHMYGEEDVKNSILDKIDITFSKDKMYAIMGPSGSGKSTLLNIIGGLLKPTSGSVLINNEDITQYDEDQLAELRIHNIGFIYQNFNLIPFLTVKENILLQVRLSKKDVNKYKDSYCNLLDTLNIKKKENDYISTLSGGEQQRVAIARCLLMEPQIILADEPTGSLDAKQTKEIMKLLQRITMERKTLTIIVTHDDIVSSYCDSILYLEDGKLLVKSR